MLRSLSKLPLRTVESEAFRALSERYLHWEENVAKTLSEDAEVKALLAHWKAHPLLPSPIHHTRAHRVHRLLPLKVKSPF